MNPAQQHPDVLTHSAFLDLDLVVPGRVTASLQAEAGDVVAVVGPNGAGKSSLVAALAGLAPATGRAHLNGRDLLALDAPQRGVGLCPQNGGLFPHLTALDNVAYGARARGVARAAARSRAGTWLERFDLADHVLKRPHQLSGGQARRVAIARALASEPDLLLLDEPTAGLDLAAATALRVELTHHLADFAGVTLLVTHTALDARTLADRIVVLESGRVVQDGSAQEVSSRPASAHVARLWGLNVLPGPEGPLHFSPHSVTVWPADSPDAPVTSARLRWHGTVAELAPWGDAVRVTVNTDAGQVLADVTPTSVAELALLPGRAVWLTVKQTGLPT